jgi:hypothetical protein
MSAPVPRRALNPLRRTEFDWFAWLGQRFPDPDDDWVPEECGDRNGEPAENYDLGCMVLACAVTFCIGFFGCIAAVILLG